MTYGNERMSAWHRRLQHGVSQFIRFIRLLRVNDVSR